MLANVLGKFRRRDMQRLPLGAIALGLLSFARLISASASEFRVIHSFCERKNCGDGRWPEFGSGLVVAGGALYGTNREGGKHYTGNVFKLVPNKDGTWHEASLFHFCKSDPGVCAGGSAPGGSVVFDVAGNIYGVAERDGAHGHGVVYELSPPTAGSKTWTEKVLYSFCAQAGCADGAFPMGQLAYAGVQKGISYDGVSPLYGTTGYGGSTIKYAYGAGVLFALTPPLQPEDPWTEQVLHTFCSAQNCADASYPHGNLLIGAAGAIYGIAGSGPDEAGIVYQFKNQAYKELYHFCSELHCTDGDHPYGGLVMNAQGSLFGTTEGGGAYDGGTVYELSFSGEETKHTLLHDFCSSQSNCVDGRNPQSQLAMDSKGRLYGTTKYGGARGFGTIFALDSAILTKVYDFCMEALCVDGGYPVVGPVLDRKGHLFGTTSEGGMHHSGEIYELTLQDKKPRGR